MEIFISYSSSNETFAKKFCDFLENNGYSCWISCRDLNKPHEIAIREELYKSDTIVLLLISSDSCQSPGQRTEARYADKFRKDVIPFLLETIPEHSGWVDYVLTKDQYYQYEDPNGLKKLLEHLAWLRNGNISSMHPTIDSRIKNALINAEIEFDSKPDDQGRIKSDWKCKYNSGDVNIIVYFDSQPVREPKCGKEIISIFGICRFNGFEREQIEQAVRNNYGNKSGKWAIAQDSNGYNLSNGFLLSVDSSPAFYRSICEEILKNFTNIINNLIAPKSFMDELGDIFTGVIAGGVLGLAGLGVADQLGVFDDENTDK